MAYIQNKKIENAQLIMSQGVAQNQTYFFFDKTKVPAIPPNEAWNPNICTGPTSKLPRSAQDKMCPIAELATIAYFYKERLEKVVPNPICATKPHPRR